MAMNEKVVKALCNPTRIKIILCLSNKQKSVSELVEVCDLAQSAVSQHLAKLKEAQIVRTSKQGKEIFYSLNNEEYAQISNLIKKISEE